MVQGHGMPGLCEEQPALGQQACKAQKEGRQRGVRKGRRQRSGQCLRGAATRARTVGAEGAHLKLALGRLDAIGFGLGVVFDKWIDRKGPTRMLPLGLLLVGLNYVVLPFAAERIVTVAGWPFSKPSRPSTMWKRKAMRRLA